MNSHDISLDEDEHVNCDQCGESLSFYDTVWLVYDWANGSFYGFYCDDCRSEHVNDHGEWMESVEN